MQRSLPSLGSSPRDDQWFGEVMRAATQGFWVGVRLVSVPLTSRRDRHRAIEMLVPLLSQQGFAMSPKPGGCHRHRVLVACDRRSAVEAAVQVRLLTAASPRGHLVIDLRDSRRSSPTVASAVASSWVFTDVDRSIADGRLDRAEALLSGHEAAARLTGAPPQSDATARMVWVRLWQGRFEEAAAAAAAAAASSETADLVLARGIVAWARGDLEGIAAAAGRWSASTQGIDRTPVSVLALLAAALARDRLRVRSLYAPMGKTMAVGSAQRGLHVLLMAEACLTVGLDLDARRLLGEDEDWTRAPALYRLLARWLRTGLNGSLCARGVLSAEIVRLDAHGIRRWGMGGEMTHLLHVIPELLHLVNESEDDLAALTGACDWMSRHTSAGGAGFIDAARGAIVAGQPAIHGQVSPAERLALSREERAAVTRRPDGIVVSAPIRYAGVRIGTLVCCGPAALEHSMAEAVNSVAALCAPALRGRLDALALREQTHNRTPEILGRSPAIAALRDAIVRAALSAFAVVIEGESGTGKELVARAIHRIGPRRDRRFAALNCAALTDELAETELFGHARGAFTGAVGPRAGLFEDAHLGTLFLDEVAELSPRTQAKLLRALQEREIRRLGENASRSIDVRVVAATNQPLAELVGQGRFRHDLLFRLAVIRIQVPPLRDRAEDIAPIALACWKQMTAEAETRALLGPDALARLARHPWPGNVRELQNVIAALAVNAPRRGRVSARLVEHVLAQTGRAAAVPVDSLDNARAACERRTVTGALARHGGRKAMAARELGMSRQGLAKAIKRLRIEPRGTVEGVA